MDFINEDVGYLSLLVEESDNVLVKDGLGR